MSREGRRRGQSPCGDCPRKPVETHFQGELINPGRGVLQSALQGMLGHLPAESSLPAESLQICDTPNWAIVTSVNTPRQAGVRTSITRTGPIVRFRALPWPHDENRCSVAQLLWIRFRRPVRSHCRSSDDGGRSPDSTRSGSWTTSSNCRHWVDQTSRCSRRIPCSERWPPEPNGCS